MMRSRHGYQVAEEDPALTHVGPGTPMGELLRRYWQPICLSDELTDLPKSVRLLCEDLIAFRDQTGRVGLLEPHCAHRGTSLIYGRIEERGIRCCYHGWLYDTQGRCVEMPCEQPGYAEAMAVWQPAYPVHEFAGLVFAYMGPLDKKPPFPRYDIADIEGRDDVVLRGMRLWDDHGVGFVRDCNWLQNYENVLDPHHLLVLHAGNSGDQFGSAITASGPPDISFEATELGVRYKFLRTLPNGNRLERYTECIVPNIFLIPSIHEQGASERIRDKASELSWCVPVDDTHLYGISIVRWPVKDGVPDPNWKAGTDTMTDIRPGNLRERAFEDKQRYPDDMEAQEGQRPIAVHAAENLALSDGGVTMLRARLRDAVSAVQRGDDPPNLFRGHGGNVVPTNAWNTVLGPSAVEAAAE